MSHVFDTGLDTPERTLIQNGAVDLLSRLKRSNGGYLVDVLPFGGIVRTHSDEFDVEQLQKWLGRTPGIAVATGRADFETLNLQRKQFRAEIQLVLYLSSQHGRSPLARMQADQVSQIDAAKDPGLHVIMAHAREIICGVFPTTLTGAVKQVIPLYEDELVTAQTVTIWTQVYRVQFYQLTPSTGGGREWRTPEQLLESIGLRVTSKENEAERPLPATSSTSLDVDTDLT